MHSRYLLSVAFSISLPFCSIASTATAVGAFRSGTIAIDLNRNLQSDTVPPDASGSFGMAGDKVVVGDWDGSGSQKLGVFRGGWWYLDINGNNQWDGASVDHQGAFGLSGDIPVVGDWTGSGVTRVGVFRNGAWFFDINANLNWDAADTSGQFGGGPNDIPIVGRWNGGSITQIGVFTNGTWYLDYNGSRLYDAGDVLASFGQAGDIPLIGHWDGISNSRLGVYRPSTGQFFVDYNGNFTWGANDRWVALPQTGIPVAGNWDGAAATKVGVFSSGTWYLDYNGNFAWDVGVDKSGIFGISGDVPIVGKFRESTSALTLSQFADCIGANTAGYGSNCILQSGTHVITNTLWISRQSVQARGEWPYPILRRGTGFNGALMQSNGGISLLHLADLVFDGNRSGGASYSAQDVDLSTCSECTVSGVTFQNSPHYALSVKPTAAVSIYNSTFQDIAYGGVYSGGSAGARCNSYWGRCLIINASQFYNIGVNAVAFDVINGLIQYNLFSGNHRECLYAAPGGQIDLDEGSDLVTVLGNTIENGPSCGNGWWAQGIELHGTNITLTDNLIRNNAGEGIYMDGAQGVTISSTNPASYPITNNNRRGVGFPGCGAFPGIRVHSSHSQGRATQNISIQNVWSIGGHSYGVEVSSCGTTGPLVNNITIQNNCLAGNLSGGVNAPAAGSPQAISNNQSSGCGGY